MTLESCSVCAAICRSLHFFNKPMAPNELFELLISDSGGAPVNRDDFEMCLQDLLIRNELAIHDNYVYLRDTDVDIGSLVKKRVSLESTVRSEVRKLKRRLRLVKYIGFIRFVGLDGSNLFVIAKTGSIKKVKFSMKFFSSKKIGDILEENNLAYPTKNLNSAYKIIMMRPLNNKKGTYERFIYKNMWVFELFPNYPLDKISLDYKVLI